MVGLILNAAHCVPVLVIDLHTCVLERYEREGESSSGETRTIRKPALRMCPFKLFLQL